MNLLEVFTQNLPSSLYKNHYELSFDLGGTPSEWRDFLRFPDNKRFIESELASITEASARQAIQKLSSGQASSSDIQAIKQILEKSQMFQASQQSKAPIVMTYLPSPDNQTATPSVKSPNEPMFKETSPYLVQIQELTEIVKKKEEEIRTLKKNLQDKEVKIKAMELTISDKESNEGGLF